MSSPALSAQGSTTNQCNPNLVVNEPTAVRPNVSQSFLTGAALGLQITSDESIHGIGTSSRIGIRLEGTQTGAAEPWNTATFGASSSTPTAEFPDYSPAALFGHWLPEAMNSSGPWSASAEGHLPELGGFSTGGDLCPPVNACGELDMVDPDLRWYYLSFSVDDTLGAQADSLVEVAENMFGTAEGTVFGYGIEGSQGMLAGYEDAVRVDYTRNQLNPGSLQIGTDAWAISALDWGAGQISRTNSGQTTNLQPRRDVFYFTLSSDWITNYGSSPSAASPITPDPATIYYMTWGAAGWSDPAVALDQVALFGQLEPNAEIDALSVYIGDGTEDDPDRVVFSLDAGDTVDGVVAYQILVTQSGNNGQTAAQAVPLQTPDGDPVSVKAGVDAPAGPVVTGPDIDSLCGRDPSEQAALCRQQAVPVEDLSSDGNYELGVSAVRYMDKDWKLQVEANGIEFNDGETAIVVLTYGWEGTFSQLTGGLDAYIPLTTPVDTAAHTFSLSNLGTMNLLFAAKAECFVFDGLMNPVSYEESWEVALEL
jgi:hypothetical protein